MHYKSCQLLEHLSPADFAIIMATGIVSIAAQSIAILTTLILP